jgi:hypothetical protein
MIRMIKSRTMGLKGHVPRIREITNAHEISVGKPEEKI